MNAEEIKKLMNHMKCTDRMANDWANYCIDLLDDIYKEHPKTDPNFIDIVESEYKERMKNPEFKRIFGEKMMEKYLNLHNDKEISDEEFENMKSVINTMGS